MNGRIIVKYSVDLECAGGNCFFLLPDRCTIRVVISEASSEKHTVEIPLRFRRPGTDAAALKIRPLSGDLDVWLVESAVLHKDLARIELQLSNVPEDVAESFKRL